MKKTKINRPTLARILNRFVVRIDRPIVLNVAASVFVRIRPMLESGGIDHLGPGENSQMNIPVRRRRLSGNPGSKSPAEWEA